MFGSNGCTTPAPLPLEPEPEPPDIFTLGLDKAEMAEFVLLNAQFEADA
jgi:hypothetical protein